MGVRKLRPDLSAAWDHGHLVPMFEGMAADAFSDAEHLQRRFHAALKRHQRALGRAAGHKKWAYILANFGPMPVKYTWRNESNPYETGYMRGAGMAGFANRGARKATERVRAWNHALMQWRSHRTGPIPTLADVQPPHVRERR